MQLVDTHAHLDGDEFKDDRADVVARARAAGVEHVVSCAQDEATWRATRDVAARFEGVHAAAGVHPHRAAAAGDMEWLKTAAQDPRVVAIGEIGLDYHYDFSPRDVQRDVFARQLDLADTLGLPAIIHNRESDHDLAAILRARFRRGRLGVVHCFLGSYDAGSRLVDEFDVYLGIGGAVTFAKTQALHDAAARLPLERLVLETDCPFMTPVPHRGHRNEPSYLPLVCRRLAELRGVSESEIASASTRNAMRLFPKLAA